MGRKFIDLSGAKFGRLLVQCRSFPNRGHAVMWHCLCDCGEVRIVEGNNLKNKSTVSCGCLRKERMTTHGYSKTNLYHRWSLMIDRCENIKSISYKYYGAKGVTICKEWREDFTKFFHWCVENGYEDSLEIDRIDPKGNYEPANCRWVNINAQAYNKGVYANNTSGCVGVTWIERDAKWTSRISVEGKRISLGSFDNYEMAVAARKAAEIKYYGELKNE